MSPTRNTVRGRLRVTARSARTRLACVVAMSGCFICGADASSLERTTGRATDLRTGRLVYEEQHWIRTAGTERSRLVVYRCPDGRAFARKRIIDTALPGAPAFEFDDARDGYREGVEGASGTRRAYWRASTAAPLRQRTVDVDADTVIDAGFDAWVRERWTVLASGTVAHAKFLMPSRGSPLPIRVQRVDASEGDLVRLRLSLDHWLGFVAPNMQVTYDATTKRLRTFEGPGTIRGEDGSPMRVRIEFPPSPQRAEAATLAYEQALKAPLATRCQ
ncbi:hypothetical protein [Lysobacter auxotrophicus]|uniref:DUF1849 family protein n=1 Tax=Lysobacter auxotrophicus TaxID=2992573 RepID=A0ABM8DDD1_9GAMM|nr:hypothetical protein [Lysobacter auxotrophicus]BDU16607.1 hypothetical protein LA521A_18080 [Lysobacter auxotrophicus]